LSFAFVVLTCCSWSFEIHCEASNSNRLCFANFEWFALFKFFEMYSINLVRLSFIIIGWPVAMNSYTTVEIKHLFEVVVICHFWTFCASTVGRNAWKYKEKLHVSNEGPSSEVSSEVRENDISFFILTMGAFHWMDWPVRPEFFSLYQWKDLVYVFQISSENGPHSNVI
jgi:hypothetical protein